MDTFDQLRIPTSGALQAVGGPDDAGRRPFSILLCVLDKPSPERPVPTLGGKKIASDKRVLMTAEMARSFGPTIIGMPLRVSERANSHREDKGTPEERMAAAGGVISNSTVVEHEGDLYWKVDGHLWPWEVPSQVMAEIERHPEMFGGSFEVRRRGEWPVEGDTIQIGPFEAQGAALLTRDSAAYQHFTQLLYAEALGVDELPADRAEATISQFRERYVAVCDAVAAGLASVDGAGGDNPPEEEGIRMAQDQTSMDGLLAEVSRQAAENAVLKQDAAVKSERLAEFDAVMAEMGAMNPKDMLAKMKAMVAEMQGKLDDMGKQMSVQAEALTAKDAEIEGLQAEAQKSAAEALFTKIAPSYPASDHTRLREVCEKQARGETASAEEFLLLASAQLPTAPDATATPPAEGGPVGGTEQEMTVEAEAAALVYSGKLCDAQRERWIADQKRERLLSAMAAE